MKNIDHLNMLISSYDEIKKKGGLTCTGISYLDGLTAARKLLFPQHKNPVKRGRPGK